MGGQKLRFEQEQLEKLNRDVKSALGAQVWSSRYLVSLETNLVAGGLEQRATRLDKITLDVRVEV